MACAKKEKGIVTPAAMVATARASDRVTLDVAQGQLDHMVHKGDLELHASSPACRRWCTLSQSS